MSTLMWHPETDGTFEAPDSAVGQYLQSGWLPASERAEHERRAAERAAAAQQDGTQAEATQASGSRGAKGKAASTEEA